MARAARTLKRVTLELGGKSASVIFADADLEQAAAASPGGVFANAGQDCCARRRVLVQRPVFDRYLSLLVDAVASWKVGDPTTPATNMGPLVSEAHRARVRSFLVEGMGEPGGGAVKPSEITPLTALRLAELALDAGLPEGVLQVVVGTGPVVGARLVDHPDVAKVAFTGSSDVGREVMARAARTLKRVTLELGGKSASVIFADADLEQAAAASPGGVFANAGQDCCARSRVLVQRPVFDRYLSLLVDAVGSWKVGDPTDPATDMGPLVTEAHRARVRSFFEEGMGEPGGGAVQPFAEGSIPGGPGFWFPPTVVAPAHPGWRMAREEIFGPVVAVIPFDDEEDAVRLANDSPYGLSGSIWTADGARALRMARAVRSGNLSVNSHSSVRVQTSFGGMKQSGFGRELGLEALDAYTEVKNVFVSTAR